MMVDRRKPLPEAVPVRRIAEILDVHISTIRRWIRSGHIIAIRVGPRLVRVPRSEISRLRKIRLDAHLNEYRVKYTKV